MSDTTQRQTLEAMQILLAARVPVLLWGDPGIGKTTTIERYAHAAGWATETVIASLHDPTDIGGLPVLTPAGVMLEPPAWARRTAERDTDTLVFFDEINTATPATHNALMRVVLSGHVGDLDLGASARFAAAANPAAHNSGAWDLSAPLANRFAHLTWPLSVDEWAAGYLAGWPEPSRPNAPNPTPPECHITGRCKPRSSDAAPICCAASPTRSHRHPTTPPAATAGRRRAHGNAPRSASPRPTPPTPTPTSQR